MFSDVIGHRKQILLWYFRWNWTGRVPNWRVNRTCSPRRTEISSVGSNSWEAPWSVTVPLQLSPIFILEHGNHSLHMTCISVHEQFSFLYFLNCFKWKRTLICVRYDCQTSAVHKFPPSILTMNAVISLAYYKLASIFMHFIFKGHTLP